ncbi:MAG: carboxypeptidase-like regulatory domain-containing protein [Daejeonella sp.]
MNNNWLDIEVLEDYLDGKLNARAMHQVEKHALEDPFVAEALAGLSQSPKRSRVLSLLQKQLQERIAQKPVERKVWGITFQRLSIAATAAVLFITAGIIFWMRGEQNNPDPLARHTFKQVEANLDTSNNYKKQTPTISQGKEEGEFLAGSKSGNYVKGKEIVSAPVIAQQEEPGVITDEAIGGKSEFYENQRSQIRDSDYKSASPVVAKTTEDSKQADVLIADKETETSTLIKIRGKSNQVSLGSVTNNTIRGRVIAQSDGLPLPGASVRLGGSDKGVATNANGEFEILADTILQSDKLKLRADYIGYASQEVIVKPDQPVNIILAEDPKSLSEVVTTGAYAVGRSKKAPDSPAKKDNTIKNSVDAAGFETRSSATPQPVGGWEYFQYYLKANNRLTKNEIIGKEVELDVLIKSSGKPGTIKVNKSLGKVYDDEAVRLIKNGPKWELPKNGTNKVILKIQF